MVARYADSVFINCPFDLDYQPLFRAIVFTVHDAGFVPRCSLELGDASEDRLTRIVRLIRECRFGIHDISRTDLNEHGLPRFNMPFELGLFIGCRRYGGKGQRSRQCLVLDRERYRYQSFLSDIAGSDVEAHEGSPKMAARRVRDWLRTASARTTVPGSKRIWSRYERFSDQLPRVCETLGLDVEELSFADYSNTVTEWLRENAPRSPPHRNGQTDRGTPANWMSRRWSAGSRRARRPRPCSACPCGTSSGRWSTPIVGEARVTRRVTTRAGARSPSG